MRETKVLFGAGKDRYGIPLTGVNLRLTQIARYASDKFGGYTLYWHDGGWIGPDGRPLEERGFTVSVLGAVLPEAETAFARKVREAFSQGTVVLIRSTGEAEFIEE